MASSSDIAVTSSNYTGNAALGGMEGLPIQIDNRPIQQLAAYTLMYNKSQYDQRQKDADELIKKLGALAPYDLVNGIEKDKKELLDAQAQLIERRAKEARLGTPSNPREKMQREVDLQADLGGILKKIEGANARKIKLDKYREATQIDPKLSAQEKELRIKQAEQLFNDTDIYTLPNIPEVGLVVPKIGEPVIESVSVLKKDKDGNAVVDESIKQFSIGGNWKNSYLDANNLNIPVLPENATQQQKDEYEQKKLAFSKNGIGAWQSAAEAYNHSLTDPNYKKTVTAEDGSMQVTTEVDIDKIKQSNPIMAGVVNLAERYNAYAQKRLEDIKKGYYIDNVTGEEVLLVGGDKAADIKFIDVTKQLKPEDLVFLDRFARAAPDQIDKKLIQTDNAIQRENNLLDYKVQWKNAETARMNALKPDGSGSAKPETVISQPAILFGEHIDRLKSAFSKNKNQPILVPFKEVDEKTRVATKLKDDQYIVYKPDGSYYITTDKKGVDNKKTVSVGTIDNLAQGFIDAVKTIDLDASKDKDGTMAEGFQVKSEAFFNKTFGTSSGSKIWEGWGKKSAAPTTVTETTTVAVDDSKLSDAEYYLKYKKARPKN